MTGGALRRHAPKAATAAALLLPWIAWRYLQARYEHIGAFAAFVDHSDGWQVDFSTHYIAGARTIPLGEKPAEGFIYPACFAFLLEPLGRMEQNAAIALWERLQFVLLAGYALLPLGLMRKRAWLAGPWIATVMLSWPLLHNLRWGQVSTAVVLLAFLAYQVPRRAALAGGGLLGLAGCVKLFPLIWAGPWLLRRNLRALVALALTTAIVGVAWPTWRLGWDGFVEVHHQIARTVGGTADYALADVNSQTFRRLAASWWGKETAATLAPWVATAATMATAWGWWTTRSANGALPRLHRFLLGALPLPFLVNTSWPHYFGWVPLGALIVTLLALEYPGRVLVRSSALGAAAVAVALSSEPVVVLAGGWEPYSTHGTLLMAHLVISAAALLLVPATRIGNGEA